MNEAQKDFVAAYDQAWNHGDPDAFDAICSASYRRESSSGHAYTLKDVKSSISATRTAFPDLATEIDDVFGEGDKLVVSWSSKGTQLGPYLGVPATGRRVVVSGITVVQFEGGKVVSERVSWNPADLLRALGVSALSETRPALDPQRGESLRMATRAVHRKFVTGVTVVTTLDQGVPKGLAVNAFASVSLDPPLILVCVAKSSASHESFMRAEHLAVNILARDQADVATTFAASGIDKFHDISWAAGVTDAPALTGAAGVFEARIHERVQASTHTMFIAEVVAAYVNDAEPLIYKGGAMFDPLGLQAIG